MTTTTREQIRALRDEASQAGDLDQVAICDRALDGDETAIAECERVIADAAVNACMAAEWDEALRIALACTFGDEYSRMLTRERVAIVDDFDAMLYDERRELWEGAAEYRRRIGKGNLTSYARTLLAQKERENREQTRAERNANAQ